MVPVSSKGTHNMARATADIHTLGLGHIKGPLRKKGKDDARENFLEATFWLNLKRMRWN